MHGSILDYLLCFCEECEKRREKLAEMYEAEATRHIDDNLRWLEMVQPAGNA